MIYKENIMQDKKETVDYEVKINPEKITYSVSINNDFRCIDQKTIKDILEKLKSLVWLENNMDFNKDIINIPVQKENTEPFKKTYTDKQKTSMKKIKESKNITENEQLNSYIFEWSDHKYKDYTSLTPENIDSFIKFMEDEF